MSRAPIIYYFSDKRKYTVALGDNFVKGLTLNTAPRSLTLSTFKACTLLLNNAHLFHYDTESSLDHILR